MRRLLAASALIGMALSGCDRLPTRQAKAPEGGLPQSTTNLAQPLPAGTTPMAERVAVLGLLNKRNGIARDITLKPGQAIQVKDVIVRLRACERTPPWEFDQLTGAFVQVDVQQPGGGWRRVFSGWLYKESPSLNVVEHPVYDVWPKSCAMNFPGAAEEAGSEPGASNSSNADQRGGATRRRSPTAATPATDTAPETADAPSPPEDQSSDSANNAT